jgi:hypothetical protein
MNVPSGPVFFPYLSCRHIVQPRRLCTPLPLAFAQIAKGELEFGFGFSEKGRLASREEMNGLFSMLNKG